MVGSVGLRCRPVALADPLRHPIRLMLGDRAQIVGDHPAADPALHPILAVIAAAIQAMPPLELADPCFDACPPVSAQSEPPPAFMRLPRGPAGVYGVSG